MQTPAASCGPRPSRTHPGRVRQVNEDACLEQCDHGIWAVADGMGGHSLGELASGLAMQSLVDLPIEERLEQRVNATIDRLYEVNRHLRAEASRRNVPLIGTTIAVLLTAGNLCSCLWAGDSRIYLYRARRLQQLTRDHSHIEAARLREVSGYDDTVELPQGQSYNARARCRGHAVYRPGHLRVAGWRYLPALHRRAQQCRQ